MINDITLNMQNINWSDLLFTAFNEKSSLVLHVAERVTTLPETGDDTVVPLLVLTTVLNIDIRVVYENTFEIRGPVL